MTQDKLAYYHHARKVNRLMAECEQLMAVVRKETHDQATICAVAEVAIAVVGVAASRDQLALALGIHGYEPIAQEPEDYP